MARTAHDFTWLDDVTPTTNNDAGTGVLPIVTHNPDGSTTVRTGANNYIRVPGVKHVKCVETVVP